MCTFPRTRLGLRPGQGQGRGMGGRLLQRVHERLRVPGRRPHALGRPGDRRASPSRAPCTTATTPRAATRGTRSSAATTTPAAWPATASSWPRAASSTTARSGHLGFAPRLTPENFRAAFTAAEGWGTFSQKIAENSLSAELALHRGRLRLETLALHFAGGTASAPRVHARLAGRTVKATCRCEGPRLVIQFGPPLVLAAGRALQIKVG